MHFPVGRASPIKAHRRGQLVGQRSRSTNTCRRSGPPQGQPQPRGASQSCAHMAAGAKRCGRKDCFPAARSAKRTSAPGRQCQFDVVSSGRSTGLWRRQASSGCFRDFDPANGRRPTSAVPRKPVSGDAIFRLPVRPVVAGSVLSRRVPEAVLGKPGACREWQLSGSAASSRCRPTAVIGGRQLFSRTPSPGTGKTSAL